MNLCEKENKMAKVAIVMGSDSDMPVMSKAADFLDQMGIDYEMTIISAHREPDIFFEWAKGAEERGVKVIIAGAGKAAHLPGMCTALFPMRYWNTNEDFRFRWSRFTLLNRSDAFRNPGCNCSY